MSRLFTLGGHRGGRAGTLRLLTPFRSCTTAELRQLERLMTRLDIPAGRVLCEEGRRGYEAIFIVDGLARVERDGEEVAILGPGDVVGELALLDRGPRNATVTAVTPMRIFVVDSREFEAVLAAAPSVRGWVEDVAASRRHAKVA